MDRATAFERLEVLLRAGSAAIGISPASVIRERNLVILDGMGHDAAWIEDLFGEGRPGWQVRATYQVIEIGSNDVQTHTEEIAVGQPNDSVGVAKAVLMAAIERRIESFFGSIE